MKRWMAAGLATALLGTGTAQADDPRVTASALAGTTGFGADLSWRLHERLGVTAQYAGGLSWDGDYESDDVNYDGDLDIAAGALKLDYYPFAGRFYLSAGVMLPNMEADIRGHAREGASFELNGQEYSASEIGTLNGKLTIADSVQPYLGLGWRSSHRSGFGFFSELGVMATDVEVSLSASGAAAESDQLQSDLREEERQLQDDAEELSVYPIAVFGVSYTF